MIITICINASCAESQVVEGRRYSLSLSCSFGSIRLPRIPSPAADCQERHPKAEGWRGAVSVVICLCFESSLTNWDLTVGFYLREDRHGRGHVWNGMTLCPRAHSHGRLTGRCWWARWLSQLCWFGFPRKAFFIQCEIQFLFGKSFLPHSHARFPSFSHAATQVFAGEVRFDRHRIHALGARWLQRLSFGSLVAALALSPPD